MNSTLEWALKEVMWPVCLSVHVMNKYWPILLFYKSCARFLFPKPLFCVASSFVAVVQLNYSQSVAGKLTAYVTR
jgi:hypothetical protein